MSLWILPFILWIHFCRGEFSQYHYTKTEVVQGSLVGSPSFSVSMLSCSAFCSTKHCESFAFNTQTGECRMYHVSLQGNKSQVPIMEYYVLDEIGPRPANSCLRNDDCGTIPSAVCDGEICRCPRYYTFIPTKMICMSDCLSLYDAGFTSDSIYEIKPDGVTSLNVSCDMTEGGWTVIQQRYTGDVNFSQASWNQSAEGFGDARGDYWLGLRYLNMLTWTENEIFFEMKLLNNTQVYFHHTEFSVANSSSLFMMKVSKDYKSNMFSPANYEGFYRHNNKYFSAWDQDNDEDTKKNCALNNGPWWHFTCGIFGYFNDKFDLMRITRTPPQKEVPTYFVQCRIKIRRY